ncbi:hypothetical protein RJT34_20229 [Clitoria ternatea]|uniref:Uncharacterized protein n=1 Tax=Clitoria ternatea TaxID=43366 RepID=A0AAN9P5K2_CLITE
MLISLRWVGMVILETICTKEIIHTNRVLCFMALNIFVYHQRWLEGDGDGDGSGRDTCIVGLHNVDGVVVLVVSYPHGVCLDTDFDEPI